MGREDGAWRRVGWWIGFKEIVLDGWSSTARGFHMFTVVKKLKFLKKPLRKLLYDKGNLHENVNRLRVEVERVQKDLDVDPFNQILRDEEACYVRAFTDALIVEERFLKQKAKVEWLHVGDSNSTYFHKSVKGRISRNRIDVITDMGGNLITREGVPSAFVSHYEAFLGQSGITGPIDFNDLITTQLDPVKALGDGFVPVSMLMRFKDAMFSMEFFTNGNLLKELNHTIIALVSKVKSPTRINDYRPISCCNVLFKCVTKIISNRIKESLKMLISPNQSAFVPDQRISDNILLTQELMHNYHLDRGSPRCAFKVDIQKAYDTVDSWCSTMEYWNE
ncbi:protein LAZ1 [Tanacetum coccineum]